MKVSEISVQITLQHVSEISCKLRRQNRKNKNKVLVRSVSAKTHHLLTECQNANQIF